MRKREDILSNEFSRKVMIKHIVHDGLQTFFTPFDLVEKMIPEDLTGTVRVFFNLEFLEVLLTRKYDMSKVQYVGDTEEKVAFSSEIYGVESVLIRKEDWDKILKNQKDIKEFFVGYKMNQAADVTFSNPPYNSNMDLKIITSLQEAKLLKTFVCVHPCTWLIEMKTRESLTGGLLLYRKIRNITRDYIRNVEFFEPNSVFGTRIGGTDCIITEIDFSKKRTNLIKVKFSDEDRFFNIASIDDITLHGKNWWVCVKSFKEKIKTFIDKNGSFNDNRVSSQEAKDSKKEFVQLSCIRLYIVGDKKDSNNCFYTLSPMQELKFSPEHKQQEIVFVFSSEVEKNNFLSTIKLDFMRLCLSINKYNSAIEVTFIPWLDFTQSWDDDKLFSFFGYEKGHPIREYAKSFLGDYYDLYPNGKTY